MLIPDPLPAVGFKVPLRAAFTGPKGVPLIALSHNSIFPRLVLYADGLAFRVFIPRRKSYADIESVEADKGFLTNNVIIKWKDSVFAFIGNVRGEEMLCEVLRFLQRRGAPLAESARKVLESNG